MKILITSASEFIGYEVVGFDHINNYCDINLKYARFLDGIAEFVKWYKNFYFIKDFNVTA